MSTITLPKVIDPAAMKPGFLSAECSISVDRFERLSRIVSKPDTMLRVKVSWGIDLDQRYRLDGQLSGIVSLQCQRCLGEFQQPIDRVFSLEIVYGVPGGNDCHSQEEKFFLAAGETIVLSDLIEDEIMLGLPMYSKHPSIENCDQSMLNKATEYKPDSDFVDKNPFAVLKNLKSLE